MSGGSSEDRDGIDPRWKIALPPAPPSAPKKRYANGPAYAELHCLSDFSFQRGASSAAELFERAADLGYSALAITDECSLAGIVRAYKASEEKKLKLIVGSEFVLDDGLTVLLLCENRTGYTNLSKLITRARRAAPKGEYRLTRDDVLAHARHAPEQGIYDGLLALWIPRKEAAWAEEVEWLQALFDTRLWISIERHRTSGEATRIQRLAAFAHAMRVPMVASGDVHMHQRARRPLQDAMTAIRLGKPIVDCGQTLFPNGERHLRPRETLRQLYDADWLAESVRIADRCTFKMDEVKYKYPAELVPAGTTPIRHLRRMAWLGAHRRWPKRITAKIRHQIGHELRLIEGLEYEAFFLTVEDIVRWARSRDILCQGRGSAANSIVCYCLCITSVSPDRIGMLFERFISRERAEPPDIDVDFEHERREEVLQYVYTKYGRERAALAATVIAYRSRSAARDLGTALGFPTDRIEELSQVYRYGFGAPLQEKLRERGFDPDAPDIVRLTKMVRALYGKPRHLSQHVGGFVISDQPLYELVPVENATMADRSVIQWDKDDLEYMKLLKVDCLALGMLTCIRKCFHIIERHGGPKLDLSDVPEGDPPTYDMIQKADTIGVFQIESRAQMSMLPRLFPETYYHLVIQIAIVRPGPIEGGMVNPYLLGRGKEREAKRQRELAEQRGESTEAFAKVTFENADFMAMGVVENKYHRAVRTLLDRTCGVPIFQEQVMALLQAAAGFSAGDADDLRRSMAAWKNRGDLTPFQARIFTGMAKRGFSDDYAERIFQQIKGFGSYGFPESHAASFGLLAYVSSWLKCRYPAAFACALLNSLPMGFYGPAQIVGDLRRHHREVRPPDVTRSEWDSRLERVDGNLCPDDDPLLTQSLPRNKPEIDPEVGPTQHDGVTEFDRSLCLRLGLRSISGINEETAKRIVDARSKSPFRDVSDLVRRARVDTRSRDALASAGALQRLAGHRHRAYWDIAGIDQREDVLRDADFDEQRPILRPPTDAENLTADYAALGLTLGKHPLQMLRARLQARRCTRSDDLRDLEHGTAVRIAGIVTLRQHPEAAKGVTFLTIEDERGLVNIVVWQQVAQEFRRPLLESRLLSVFGRVERKDGVQHVIAQKLSNWNDLLGGLRVESRDFH